MRWSDASSAVVARAQPLILDGLRGGAMVGRADWFAVDNNYAASIPEDVAKEFLQKEGIVD